MTEHKNVIGESRCVRVVLFNTQVRFMLEQTIQNVSCIANRHVDNFGVKGCVLVGNATEEQNLVNRTRFRPRRPLERPVRLLHRRRVSLASLPLQQVPGYSCNRLAWRESLRKHK